MNLISGSILRGLAGTANAVSYNVFGQNTTGFDPLPQPLGQGVLLTTSRKLYTADRDVTITSIQLVNTTGVDVSGVTLYLNNVIVGVFTIPANSTFSYSNGVWNTGEASSISDVRIQDSAGNSLDSTGGSLDVNVTSILSPLIPVFATRSDTFIVTGNGGIVDVSASPVKYFSIQVTQTGIVTAWDVRLEGSLDGVVFTSILTHTEAAGSGEVIYIGTITASSLYFRSRCHALTLGGGSAITVMILGTV